MVRINYKGRMGNKIIQYLAASIFCEKFDLKLINYSLDELYFLKKIDGYFPNEKEIIINNNEKEIIINNNNYFNYLNKSKIDDNIIYMFDDFFQIYDFFEIYEDKIFERFEINNNEKITDKYIIHIRLGDCKSFNGHLDFEYYENSIIYLSKLNINDGYIITDSPNDDIVKKLLDKYNIELYNSNNYINDFIFAMNFNNIILSQGTFSFLIGFLSRADNIICKKNPDKLWHGDIFKKSWIRVK